MKKIFSNNEDTPNSLNMESRMIKDPVKFVYIKKQQPLTFEKYTHYLTLFYDLQQQNYIKKNDNVT